MQRISSKLTFYYRYILPTIPLFILISANDSGAFLLFLIPVVFLASLTLLIVGGIKRDIYLNDAELTVISKGMFSTKKHKYGTLSDVRVTGSRRGRVVKYKVGEGYESFYAPFMENFSTKDDLECIKLLQRAIKGGSMKKNEYIPYAHPKLRG